MNIKYILTAMCCLWLGSTFVINARDPRAADFNDGWRFTLGDDPAYAERAYDDSSWRRLSLPHDWAIEGDFAQDNPSGTGGGALPGGIGWYRKTFTVPSGDMGKQMFVDFDGVYMNGTVYINGHCLGTRPYGYASYSYDITPYLRYGGENVMAVRVDNAEQPNSRWYSGCGIYRNVWLRSLDSIHVAKDGTFVRTSLNPARTEAEVYVDIEIEHPEIEAGLSISNVIYDPQGHKVAESCGKLRLYGIGNGKLTVYADTLHITGPQLWSTDDPNLYRMVTTLGSKPKDTYETTFGIRDFAFDANSGFKLNGKPMKINGVCLHHDLGALGAAVNTRAIERQLEIMREMGVNAIRCSHNPPAPELLDLCDRMGFIVMDETFDMWRRKKTSHDYSRYFDDWHERDLTDLVKRDRNHPSVMIWSIGNEVLEQWSDANADTLSLEEANLILNFGHSADMLASDDGEMSVNSMLTRKLADMTRALDPTRPVTSGCNEPNPGNHLFKSGALDIIGYNYHDDWFKDVPANFPGMPFIITESVSALQTRGYYRMPSDSMLLWPVRWDIPFYDESFKCSAYDNCHAPWGNCHEGTLRHVVDNDFISGQFIWTGFDYIGEPTPYGWPARSSYFGIVDLAGFPKDVYYMYQSEWRPDKTVLHLYPHWNWTPGQTVDMWCYYNNADDVELFVNGKSQGVKAKGNDFHAMWRVTYEPGEVTAVSRKDGIKVARQTIRTASEPYAIVLTPDRDTITGDGRDLSYVTVEVVDKDGNLCPLADDLIEFEVTGAGFNAGVDNGLQTSLERFKDDKRHAFNGKAMIIIQSDGTQGTINVAAKSANLQPANTTISTIYRSK